MKKLPILLGALGSTTAFYILSNKKIRTELGRAKTPEETVAILKKYVGGDVSKIAKHVHEFIHSEDVQENLSKAKEFTEDKFEKAKKGFGSFLSKAKEAAENLKEKGWK